MNKTQQDKAVRTFQASWTNRGYEKGESQQFWLDLLSSVFGIEDLSNFISFENQVKLSHTSFIDGYIPSTKVLIEQKSLDKDLSKPIKQSDGSELTPFEQAKRYASELPVSKHPRWIVVCNFRSWYVYDMEKPQGDPQIILLENFHNEYHRLSFLVQEENVHLNRELQASKEAGEIIGQIYDKLLTQYNDPTSPQTLHSLNILCVRLVFCMYAEDAGVFDRKQQFGDYISRFPASQLRRALLNLFEVLDTDYDQRDPYLEEELSAFPYVSGGLFSLKDNTIPQFTDDLRELLIGHASGVFDWSEISPTIFGAIFESTLNPETRRSGGMHYTSIENIHKVIDPLFLSDLTQELDTILAMPQGTKRDRALCNYQDRLAALRFLDPACGSGNFLTETYISLRRLENRCFEALYRGQTTLDYFDDRVKVSINQFYGIEINDFAATVAKTALWIAESQMLIETCRILQRDIDFLPLKSYSNIVVGNALTLDWNTVCPAAELNYIIGNPPFVGHQWRSPEQVKDMDMVFDGFGNYGKLDYVCCWYKKAADYMLGTKIKAALVSTNSIVQGESVATMWKPFFEKYPLQITFAHQTFRWDSEASIKAHVHCVIIGFCLYPFEGKKYIFNDNIASQAENINGYLLNAPNIFIENRGGVLNPALPKMTKGSQATDGGNLMLTTEERDNLLLQYPSLSCCIKRIIGADDFINNKYRYCLWLKGISPTEYRKVPFVIARLEAVREARLKSPTVSVQRDADTPMLFTQIRQPETDYLVIPRISSYQRRYIPVGYMSSDVIANDKVMFIPNASLLLLGVLVSNVHMAWMRIVAGRLKSDYSYTPAVYNNFPWPTITPELEAEINRTAQAILDARALYPECSLADLYDEVTMPVELRRAHQANDKAVMKAYGIPVTTSESDTVAHLFKLYEQLTKK